MVGVLHFTPDQVRRMSLKEIALALEGFAEFNGGKEPPPSQEEIEEMMRLHPDT